MDSQLPKASGMLAAVLPAACCWPSSATQSYLATTCMTGLSTSLLKWPNRIEWLRKKQGSH